MIGLTGLGPRMTPQVDDEKNKDPAGVASRVDFKTIPYT